LEFIQKEYFVVCFLGILLGQFEKGTQNHIGLGTGRPIMLWHFVASTSGAWLLLRIVVRHEFCREIFFMDQLAAPWTPVSINHLLRSFYFYGATEQESQPATKRIELVDIPESPANCLCPYRLPSSGQSTVTDNPGAIVVRVSLHLFTATFMKVHEVSGPINTGIALLRENAGNACVAVYHVPRVISHEYVLQNEC
jgi:hypothetical protein